MSELSRLLTTLIVILVSSSMPVFTQETSMMEYINLGKFSPIRLQELSENIDLPYYKPEGITQIPSWYFNALVIQKLVADDKEIIPIRQYFSSHDTVVRQYIEITSNEASNHTLRMPWSFERPDYMNDINIIRKGLFFRHTSINEYPEVYNIPYGALKISLTYSIRFLIYDIQAKYKLIDTIESEKMGVCWELEWTLPEAK